MKERREREKKGMALLAPLISFLLEDPHLNQSVIYTSLSIHQLKKYFTQHTKI
jgi:hypothetical protein